MLILNQYSEVGPLHEVIEARSGLERGGVYLSYGVVDHERNALCGLIVVGPTLLSGSLGAWYGSVLGK